MIPNYGAIYTEKGWVGWYLLDDKKPFSCAGYAIWNAMIVKEQNKNNGNVPLLRTK